MWHKSCVAITENCDADVLCCSLHPAKSNAWGHKQDMCVENEQGYAEDGAVVNDACHASCTANNADANQLWVWCPVHSLLDLSVPVGHRMSLLAGTQHV